jgi:hypothetical protein
MSNPTKVVGKVPFRYKVAFGVGMLANQMFPAVLWAYLWSYLSRILVFLVGCGGFCTSCHARLMLSQIPLWDLSQTIPSPAGVVAGNMSF